jgi:alpha-L-fucosidase
MPGKWGASTCKDDQVYLFVTEWPAEGPLRLPPLSQTITGGKTMSGDKVAVQQSESEIAVTLPASKRDPIATVIILNVDGRAVDIPSVKVP